MKTDPFANKISIVTGGASGIGQALCEALAVKKGKMIVVADINEARAKQVAHDIQVAGGQAEAAVIDVTQAVAVETLINRTVTQYGQLDYMFNNAGIGISGEAQDMTLAHWQRLIDVALWGVIYGTHAAYAVMLKQSQGHIVNTASASGLMPVPMGLPYATAKHGVVGLSTALRMEGADRGVWVSVVCPGVIQTPIFETSETVTPFDQRKWLDNPMNRMMDPAKCARIILKGVAHNKGIITVTPETKLMWWINRLSPALMDLVGRVIARKFREISANSR